MKVPLLFAVICYSQLIHALDDISLSDRIRQEQRLKDLSQQLEDKIPQLSGQQLLPTTVDFKTIIVQENPCVEIKQIGLEKVAEQSAEDIQRFNFIVQAIQKHPQQIMGKCLGTQSLRNLVNFAQNELIKKGFITSQITVNPQDLNQGHLSLGIQTGYLRNIILKGEHHSAWQLKTALPFKEGDILNLKQLDQGLENLKRVYRVDIQIVPVDEDQQELIGYSDLVIQLEPLQKVNLNLSVDDSGSQDTGKYMASLGVGINNPFHFNDALFLNFSHSLDDLHQDRNKSYFASYQLPLGNYDFGLSYNQYQYEQNILGANGPLLYHGDSKQSNISLSRVLSRSGQHKTSVYGKVYHKEVQNFIDDIEINVLHRKTSGWNLGLQHRQYLGNATLDTSLDYRKGTGALNALLAPEEQIEDIYNNRLPAEGYSRAPLWTADLRLNLPFLILDHPAQYRINWRGQYAPKILVPNDRFYIGGRYSVRGFEGDLMLTGDNGQYLQQEISLNTALTNTQFYMGIDQGWVSGRNSIPGQRYLMGSIFGLRTYQNSFYLDAFAGRGLIAPESIKKQWVTGFSINLSY